MNNKWHIYLLSSCVVVLCLMIGLGIRGTMSFGEQREQREQVVKRRLVAIRAAEAAYRTRHGVYTADFGKLIHEGLLADSTAEVPYSGGKRFSLSVSSDVSRSGKAVPLMECSATYADYLSSLDADAVAQLTADAEAAGRFPGLKVGGLSAANDGAGNWE